MSDHALFSPSSAHRWVTCPGSLALEKDVPNISSAYADEGTTAHAVAAGILTAAIDNTSISGSSKDTNAEMVEHGIGWARLVTEIADGGEIFVERRVDFSSYIGQPSKDAFGTADAIILRSDGELVVVDFKFGMGVKVDAEENEQLMLYALGAYAEFSLTHEITSARLVISQPRLNHVSEWSTPVEYLEEFAKDAKAAARLARLCLATGTNAPEFLAPSEDACRFCRAKHKCPALSRQVYSTVFEDFDDLSKATATPPAEPTLDQKMSKVAVIEQWCKAIRAEVERTLFAGLAVPGWKLVQGKRGHRKWADEAVAEQTMKAMRLKRGEMYDYSLISPTSAEKIFADGNPRRWNKLAKLITQHDGKPSVAPAADKRPAFVATSSADAFEDETGSDLV